MTTRPLTTARQQREESVRTIISTLERIVADPDFSAAPELKVALRSQGALARYASDSLGIIGMSLNTQKTIADQCCGGYEKLDALRAAASAALEAREAKEAGPNKGTKEDLKRDNEELRLRIGLLESDLGQLTWAFGRIVAYARSQAQDASNPHAMTQFVKELRAVESGLSLLRKPLETNVVSGGFGG